MKHISKPLSEALKELLEAIYNGNAPLDQKIAYLIIARAKHHGDDDIQNKCNEYLTKLYDEKYNQLRRK